MQLLIHDFKPDLLILNIMETETDSVDKLNSCKNQSFKV